MSNTSFPRLVLALLAVTALTLAACSGSSSEGTDAGPGDVGTESTDDDAGDTGDTGSDADDGDSPADAAAGLPDWYVCDADTFFAASIPVSVVGAHTPEDEELGGIYAQETFTFGIDGDNSRCEIFYGQPDSEAGQRGNLDVSAIAGDPTAVARLFDNSVVAAAEPETIGTVDARISNENFKSTIYFEVDGAGVIVTVNSFVADHDANEAGVIGLELAELVVAAATTS